MSVGISLMRNNKAWEIRTKKAKTQQYPYKSMAYLASRTTCDTTSGSNTTFRFATINSENSMVWESQSFEAR
ncbi:hypothetical protein CO2235_MP10375 [Cupriavidus oxalaticus]|uniref:Uncharacterized protein n=1 Tax=Cupriavidus oxalaticus TaxID=96344 RepID=A0A375GFM4_9BURK|nr:hypothetical protein CO2235_MP10375 [Cupriavidus oxalaticus]